MNIRITTGTMRFIARLEEDAAPLTCVRFLTMLPWHNHLLHCRWSGESMWVPLGELAPELPFENHTSYPHPGQVLLYAAGYSEAELLLPYGACRFASKLGQLAGNHFLTIIEGQHQLADLGRQALWEGARDVLFETL